jgi:hypothetical protein
MLDYLRNLTKSEEEKRQETLNAYLDDALTPEQRKQVESNLARDKGQRAELDQLRLLQQQMRQLPQRRVRRNFTLDPTLYGRPRREPLIQAYPVLRTATVLAAFVFIFALAANLFLNGTTGMMPDAESVAMEAESQEAVIAEAAVEEVEADSMATAAESMEKAADVPLITEEMAVDSRFEMPADEAEAALEQLEMESEAAVPLESALPLEEPRAVGPAENGALAVMPTIVAEGPTGAELAAELQPAPMVVATEPAEQLGPRSAEVTGAEEDVMASEIQAQGDRGLFWANSMGLIVLLLGIVFVILIVLTLLARHRL